MIPVINVLAVAFTGFLLGGFIGFIIAMTVYYLIVQKLTR
jgi:preprotein translocase subunit Sss1